MKVYVVYLEDCDGVKAVGIAKNKQIAEEFSHDIEEFLECRSWVEKDYLPDDEILMLSPRT